jgi:hypothetical protein
VFNLDGNFNRYEYLSGWFEDKSKQFKEINQNILKDVNEKYDFRNITIILPDDNWLINREIVSSHVADIVDLKRMLHKIGVTFKNNISLLDRKYSQSRVGKLVIQDGIAYANPYNSNPFQKAEYEYKKEIHINGDDKLILNNKPILLSGIALHLFKSL